MTQFRPKSLRFVCLSERAYVSAWRPLLDPARESGTGWVGLKRGKTGTYFTGLAVATTHRSPEAVDAGAKLRCALEQLIAVDQKSVVTDNVIFRGSGIRMLFGTWRRGLVPTLFTRYVPKPL